MFNKLNFMLSALFASVLTRLDGLWRAVCIVRKTGSERRFTCRLEELSDSMSLEILNPRTMTASRLMEIGKFREYCWSNVPVTLAEFKDFKTGFWLKEQDYVSYHFVLTKNKKIVAAATMLVNQDELCSEDMRRDVDTAYLGRLVVDPDFREKGLAGILVDCRIKLAQELGCEEIFVQVLNARVAHYQGLGFSHLSREFCEKNAMEINILSLANSSKKSSVKASIQLSIPKQNRFAS